VSWFGNSLLPCVQGAVRSASGELREPESPAQLAEWLRSDGCEQEARYVEGLDEATFRHVLDWVKGVPWS
jgi:hypothetical protein